MYASMADTTLSKNIMAKSMKHLKQIGTKIVFSFLFLLSIFLLTPLYASSLIDLDYSVLAGNTVKLEFKFDGSANIPRTFNIEDPARIAIDFLNTKNMLKQRNLQVGIGVIQSITSAYANNRTRVVLNLIKTTEYSTDVSNNTVTITLAGNGESLALETNTAIADATSAPIIADDKSGELTNTKGITGIDFKRGTNGEGRIIIDLTNTSIATDIWREGDDINVEFLNSQLPEELQRRMDVGDFATPISFIDTIQDGSNIKMSIKAHGQFDHLAYQTDNIFTIEVQELSKQEEEKIRKEKFGYTGERLSLNFQDIEVRSVLQLLADFTSLNLVVSDSVTGNLTLRLKNVPWDQAMDIILKTKGLAQRKSGNVILVAPTDEIAAREKLELEALRQVEELETLRTEFIRINYAKAGEMASLLNLKDNEILSPRGSVSVDERTNTIIVKDTNDSLLNVRRLLDELDIPIRQVLIESRIVIANDDFSKELGVRFGVSNDSLQGNTTGSGIGTSGTLNGTTQLLNNNTLEADDRLNVNLPVQNPVGTFALALAKLPLGTLLEMELSAAQVEGRGEVVSSPRIITSNSHTAKIEQGVEIPYLSRSDGDVSVTFRKAVLLLEVTPQITPDDRIIMDLSVHKDSQGPTITVGNALTAPTIETRNIETQVLVDNGQTVVLGGIHETIQSKQVSRVPFFSDLPLIGNLFKTTSKVDDRSELLIFVTPKILSNGNIPVR